MGINPLNLQLSVPRTPELSSLQQQAMQRPVTEQTILASDSLKHTDELRSVANPVDEIEKSLIHDQESGNQQEHQSKKQKQADNSLDQGHNDDSKHPYKGHKFDIRL